MLLSANKIMIYEIVILSFIAQKLNHLLGGNFKLETYQIIIDTNVLVAAIRSKRGASYLLLELLSHKDKHET
jgi:hypothetical protein